MQAAYMSFMYGACILYIGYCVCTGVYCTDQCLYTRLIQGVLYGADGIKNWAG